MAEEGLEFLKNHHIDLVLMDISLPMVIKKLLKIICQGSKTI
jgi:CheY-like chemotaxis protein